MVRRTLDGMSAGGLYDVVGGGFHRYSVDARWLVPHFEKMLYDNALLTSTYLHAWVVTGEERYRAVVEETIGYLLREMRLESGGFASAQDADTDGRRGADVHLDARRVGGARARPGAARALRARPRRSSAASSTPRRRSACSRSATTRPQPFRDDKAIAAWNGLALAALAEAARRLERADWLDGGRGARRRSCSARSAATTAACCGASARAG